MLEDLIAALGPDFQMWAVFVIIVVALAFYAFEWLSMEVTSLAVICVLMVFFHWFPILDDHGKNLMAAKHILLGFANPALLTVLALLVVGQGMVRTGVLDRGAKWVLWAGRGNLNLSILVTLLVVLFVSAFLNNIPVVVIFIPIMQGLAEKFGHSASRVMMPLSFAAVLGGMTTLIGSGTNLLVSSALIGMGEESFGFFDFTLPGTIMALAGLAFIILVVPRLLPDRAPMVNALMEGAGKQFIAQINVTHGSDLVGKESVAGLFPGLKDMTVRMVHRGEEAILPPFEDVVLEPGDILVVAATRQSLTKALEKDQALLMPDLGDGDAAIDNEQPWMSGNRTLAEVMVAPASRMAGQTLKMIGFRYKTRCIVLGIQRRSRMIRAQMTDIRLMPGDVLLVKGQPEDVAALRNNRDVVLLEWSASELPALDHARRASLIFLAVVGSAASGLLPIVISALTGAAAMIAVGALNIRQASRAIDSKIATMIPAALALGAAMHQTGGAAYIAHLLISALQGAGPTVILSAFFLLTAILTNIIGAKAIAVLFAPIAVDIARELGVDPMIFAVALVFAANCAFATPIGYQTSLLVMGPGHYTFSDFVKGGAPLVIFMWLVFTLVGPWYYGL